MTIPSLAGISEHTNLELGGRAWYFMLHVYQTPPRFTKSDGDSVFGFGSDGRNGRTPEHLSYRCGGIHAARAERTGDGQVYDFGCLPPGRVVLGPERALFSLSTK